MRGRRRWRGGFFLCIALFTSVAAIHDSALYKDSADVVEVEADTFDHFIAKGNVVMKFYAHWCPHCQTITNLIQQQARSFQDSPLVKFAAVDCAEFHDVCERYSVRAYPTIKFFTSNVSAEPLEFPAARGYTELGAWVSEEFARLQGSPRSKLAAVQTANTPALEAASTTVPTPWKVEHSQPTARLWDALLALLYSLRQSTSLFESSTSRLYDAEAFPDLMAVLGTLSRSLPSLEARIALKSLMNTLTDSATRIVRSDFETLLDAVQLGPVQGKFSRTPEPHFRQCTTYTCGLWTLFHILMLSSNQVFPAPPVATGFMAGEQPTTACTPEEVSDIMQTFVDRFFPCKECRAHFLKMWENDTEKPTATTERYDGVMWLWSTHNTVNERLWKDRASDTRWPSFDACTHCRTDHSVEGDFIPSLVYQHLLHTYWSSEYVTVDTHSTKGWLLVVIPMFAVVATLYACLSGPLHAGTARKSA